ncbi:MAG TPA: FAD-dependent oxidoreductase [Deinococcales bacterium]|nr:FAD-dependent oxidoreductase [Deinococcales bacterium]
MCALRVAIVGGVAGGASAATRLRRLDEQASITVFERGDFVSFANCGLPYRIGGRIEEDEALLLQTPESLHARFRLNVRVRHEVLSIDRQARAVRVRDRDTGREFEQPFDKLVLSPGAAPVRPNLPGVEHALSLRDIPDMRAILERLDTGRVRQAVVVGGGFVGLEMAENLGRRGLRITVVEAAPQVMIGLDPEMAALVQAHLRERGIELHLGDGLKAIEDAGRQVVLQSGARLNADLVVLAIGVRPETGLARAAGLTIGPRGGIQVNASLQTSDPDIYAVGDAVEKENRLGEPALVPLAWAANRQGRLVADHTLGRPVAFRPSLGTAIVQVFGLSVAATGLNEKQLRAAGRPHQAIHTHPGNHAGYYPGAQRLSLKLLFDPTTGEILGAQAVGGPGTDKRIDVLATAIQAGWRAPDLAELELAYAPPYSSAKDPVNMLGYIAQNVLDGMTPIQWHEFPGPGSVLDVRDRHEFAAGHVPGALNVPLNELREHLDDLPAGPISVYCQVGLRGYLAVRLLRQHAKDARNLDGGLVTLAAARPELIETPEPQATA